MKVDLGIDKTTPHWTEWYVARAILFSPGARKWFREAGYGPDLFRDPVAAQVIGWSLLERRTIPAPLQALMEYKETALHTSFSEFALTPHHTYPEGEEPTIEGDDTRFQWQAYHYTLALNEVRGVI